MNRRGRIERVDLLCNVHYIFRHMGDYLGEFEHLVLLALARLGDEAYGVTIRQMLEERTGRQPSFGAIYSTLRRLEQKGLVRSYLGEPAPVRGGRAKKHVVLTTRGRSAMRAAHSAVLRMGEGIAGLARSPR